MYNNEQYKKDLAHIGKIDAMISRKIDLIAYFFALSACFAAHTLYLALFAAAGVRFMMYFNIFSVTFYLVTILLVNRVKDKQRLVYAALAEIIVHAAAATVCVGLIPDFCMFLLMIIPLAFLMPNKNKKMPFIIMFVSVPLYGFLRFWLRDPKNAIYDLGDNSYASVFYIINIIVGSFVLIYVASIFTVMNRYTECRLRVQTAQLREMASTDPLTKLVNRREISKKLAEIAESGRGYVLGIGDIDNFKRVNDTYGHDMGDSVLSAVAGIFSDGLPESGCAARWGGEEFLFVIPDSGLEDGLDHAENIIQSVSKRVFNFEGQEFSVTMTVGLCDGLPGENIDKVITCADGRLYKGKRSGKNRVEYTG